MMTDAEFGIEINSLTNIVAELEEKARALSNQLAPVKRREQDIKRRLIATYRNRERDDGQYEVMGFRGERKTVLSTRVVAPHYLGDDKVFDYEEVEALVLVSDPNAAMARLDLFAERDRLADLYGDQRNEERNLYADIEAAQRAMDRLRKAREAGREKRRKVGSNGPQSTMF
jgi:hypothetical protein